MRNLCGELPSSGSVRRRCRTCVAFYGDNLSAFIAVIDVRCAFIAVIDRLGLEVALRPAPPGGIERRWPLTCRNSDGDRVHHEDQGRHGHYKEVLSRGKYLCGHTLDLRLHQVPGRGVAQTEHDNDQHQEGESHDQQRRLGEGAISVQPQAHVQEDDHHDERHARGCPELSRLVVRRGVSLPTVAAHPDARHGPSDRSVPNGRYHPSYEDLVVEVDPVDTLHIQIRRL
mmetsp:Transcript_72599/g.210133  ORF Transcript_72599/g.210133 Transcript_72599/m.210133 type:complete len:228 (-) Transcript_72599:2304-2987(-)